jgi:hypothetical protein
LERNGSSQFGGFLGNILGDLLELAPAASDDRPVALATTWAVPSTRAAYVIVSFTEREKKGHRKN